MKNWYEKWFSSADYLNLYSHRGEKEAEDMINLIQREVPKPTDSKVLDVCCGAGRHTLALARRGYDVTGFDLSHFLISQAKKNINHATEKNLKAKFDIRDMKNFAYKAKFDIAINIFSSFGYFESDEENFRVFSNIARSLKKNGFFVFDFLNENYLRRNLVPCSESSINGKKVIQKRRIENNFVFKDISIGSRKYTERIKLYQYDIIINTLKSLGFSVRAVYGDCFGNPFKKKNSERFIIFAGKN